MSGTGLVRLPGSRLAEGIVTYLSRTAMDVAVARAQLRHAGALVAAAG